MVRCSKTICIILVLAAILSMVACGSDNKPEQTAASQSEQATTAAMTQEKPKEPVKLKLMLNNGDDVRKQINTKYIEANLQAELPDYTVEVELVPTDYVNKMRILNSTGELPDVFFSNGADMVTPMMKANAVGDLLPYITKDGFADKFKVKELIQPWSDGKLYTLDPGSDAYFVPRLFYNKDIFEKYNIAVPITYDDFINACKALKSNGIIPMAIYGKEGWSLSNYLFEMLLMSDKPEVLNDLTAGRTDFSNPACQDALKRIQSMVNEGFVQPGVSSMEYGAVQQLFTSKKAAMYGMCSWDIAAFEKDPNVDFMDFPQINPGIDMSKSTQIYSGPLKGYGISSSSKVIDAAVKLAEYCAMQDAKFFNIEQKAPVGIETGVKLEGLSPLMDKNLKAIDASTVKFNLYWFKVLSAKTMTDIKVTGEKFLTGKYDPEQFAKDLNASFLEGMKEN